MKEILELLEYNFWANDQFIIRLAEQDELNKEIQKLFSHMLSAHRVWLNRIRNNGDTTAVWEEIPVTEWEEMNITLYNETTDLVKSTSLYKVISYKNSRGELFGNELWSILYHVVNHSTHHRAQVAMLMRQNHMLPPASDYIFFIRRGK